MPLTKTFILYTSFILITLLSANVLGKKGSGVAQQITKYQSDTHNVKKARNDRKFSSSSLKQFIDTSSKRTSLADASHIMDRMLPQRVQTQ